MPLRLYEYSGCDVSLQRSEYSASIESVVRLLRAEDRAARFARAEKPNNEAPPSIRGVIKITVRSRGLRQVGITGDGGPRHQPLLRTDKMIMGNSRNRNTGADCEILSPEQLEIVSGGLGGDNVVIVGCTTRPPMGGYPPGTIVINPWLGSTWRW